MNPGPIQQAKRLLRQEIRTKLARLTADERAVASARARQLLCRRETWTEARSVLLFAPMAEELDVWPLVTEALEAGKRVALPRYDARSGSYHACEIRDCESDVCPGSFGIREPRPGLEVMPGNRLDLIVVPGIAFDLSGRRLGRGKGYYDRWLPGLRGKTCGVAFDEQIVDGIPFETHDVVLNCILTPTRWIES